MDERFPDNLNIPCERARKCSFSFMAASHIFIIISQLDIEFILKSPLNIHFFCLWCRFKRRDVKLLFLLKTKKAGVTSPAAAKLYWIKNYFGVCRLWASTRVPSFRV